MTAFNLRIVAMVCLLAACNMTISYAQVGINTTSPNGILDLNSTTTGFVLPRLALTATNSMSPAVNPQGGGIPVGTVIYNTATTNTGSNDVTPGMYVWDGAWWRPQFKRKQHTLHESNTFIRTRSNGGFANISGLTSRSFTPKYTGTYRVEVTVNYGGGGALVPNAGATSDGNLNIARASGTFRLAFDGTNYDIPVQAYSTSYDSSVGATNYFAIWEEFTYVMYVTLTATNAISYTLSFDQDDAPEFVSGANGSTGRGYVAYDIPCTVELTYLGD